MSIIKNANIEVLAVPAAIFNAEIATEKVLMDNFQTAHFCIMTGEGAETKVTAKVIATDEAGETEKVIIEKEITIGGKTKNKIVVDADSLAHDNFDRLYLKISNAGKADILGGIFALLSNERYTQ